MKNKKILALLMAVVLLLTQFAMLGTVSAATALTGRTDFGFGISAHRSNGYAAYTEPYEVVLDTAALGANLVRVDTQDAGYDLGFAKLANKHGLKVMFVKSFGHINSEAGRPYLPEEMDYNAIYESYYNYALALKDTDVYIQIGNEMCNQSLKSSGAGHGTEASNYKDLTGVAIAVYVANKAIHDAAPNIKTIVNFSWKHYGFLSALKNVKIDPNNYAVTTGSDAVYADWDITGVDIYADSGTTYQDVIPTVISKFGKKVIVCESGIWPTGQNEDGSITYTGDAAWLETFITYCYNNSNVIGFCNYELYDQPAFSADGWHKESHYGLIDKDGNKKAHYDTVCALYGGTGEIARNRVIPAAPEMNTVGEVQSVFYDENDYGNTIPTAIGDREFVYIDVYEKYGRTVDFTQGNAIEFDLYVEDAEMFNAAVKRHDAYIHFAFTDVNHNMKNCSWYTLDVKNDGWNHITTAVSGTFNDGSIDWSQVVKVTMKVYVTGGTYTEVAGMNVNIANICSTQIEAPNMIEDATSIIKDGVLFTIAAGKNYNWINDNSYREFAAIDASEGSNIEFDIYVPNAENFKAAASASSIRFIVHTQQRWSHRAVFNFADQIKNDGWNHIILSKGDSINIGETADYSQVVGISLCAWSGSSATNPTGSDMVILANLVTAPAEIDRVPDLPEYAEVEILTERKQVKYGNNFNWMNDNSWNTLNLGDARVDISKHSVVEFDLYVEDIDNFKAMNNMYTLSFVIHTTGRWSHRARFSFISQITKSGWNHVVINLADRESIGETPDFTQVAGISFCFWSNPSVANPYSGDDFAVANVCACPAEIDKIPAKPADYTVDISEGKLFSYGTNYVDCDGYSLIELKEPVDISKYGCVEFDIYVENYEELKEMHEKSTFRFVIHTKGRWSYRAAFNIFNQITKSGWNHVKVELAKRENIGETPDFTQVTHISLAFWNNGSTAMPYGKTNVRYTNIVASPAEIDKIPAAPEYATVTVLKDYFGNTYGNQYNWTQDRVYTAVDSVDLSSASNIEFDIYIDDYDAFVSAAADYSLRFTVSSGDTRFANRNAYTFTDQITKSGWNHIVIDKSKPATNGSANFASIKWLGLAFWSGNGVSNPIANTTVRIANVYGCPAEVDMIPAAPANIAHTLVESSAVRTYPAKFEWLRDDTINKNAWFDLDFNEGDYIELDFYVDDYEEFQAMIAAGGDLRYYVGSTTADWGNEVGYVVVNNYVTKSGWNHIKVALKDLVVPSGKPQLNTMKLQYFQFAKSGSSATWDNTVYRYANICITKAEINILPEAPKNIVHTLQEDSGKRTWPANYSYLINETIKTGLSLDFTDVDYIEFDFYVENIEGFKAMVEGVEFRFVVGSDNDWGNRMRYIVLNDLITKEGWNHIKVAKADMINTCSYQSSPNWSAIYRYCFQFSPAGSTSQYNAAIDSVMDNAQYRYANLCGTSDIRVPTDVMEEKVEFIGAKLQTVKFDVDGMYVGEVAADITGARMIELDVYVTDALSALEVWFLDANENIVTYTFDKEFAAGWNHLAVRVDDYASMEGEFDYANIMSYILLADADAKVYVSNFYAADYVDGDANRDGVLDLKDVVRAKKLVAGITTEGNVLAVSGEDYEIDGTDLTATSDAVINAIFG